MRRLFLLFLFFQVHFLTSAQDTIRCIHSALPHSEAEREQEKIFNERLRSFTRANFRLESNEIVIPVVVHVVYNKGNQKVSYEQVLSQIDVLNKDYTRSNADTSKAPSVFKSIAGTPGFKFKLAIQDPDGNPTDGVTYTFTNRTSFKDDDAVKRSQTGGKDAWDTRQYLNIWVCNLSGGTLGYFPNRLSAAVNTPIDGVVVAYRAFGTLGPNLSSSYNLGRTTTHEVGHWLGLYHLWGQPDSAGCTTDEITDTPPQSGASTGCPRYPYIEASCNNAPYGRNFSNYMDYTADACMNMFTRGQVERMQAQYHTYRSVMADSKGLTPPFTKDISVKILADSLQFCQKEKSFPVLKITNYGKDTITSFLADITCNNTNYTFNWEGVLPSCSDTLIPLDMIDRFENPLYISVEVSLVSSNDEFPANNTAIRQISCSNPLGIFPNPADEELYLTGNAEELESATIFTLSGQQVAKFDRVSKINLSGLRDGFYLIILKTNERSTRHQFIVLHN